MSNKHDCVITVCGHKYPLKTYFSNTRKRDYAQVFFCGLYKCKAKKNSKQKPFARLSEGFFNKQFLSSPNVLRVAATTLGAV